MRELTSNGVTVKVLASNLARHYFYQEFNHEIDEAVADIFTKSGGKLAEAIKRMTEADIERLRTGDAAVLEQYGLSLADFTRTPRFPVLDALKIVWAMNKAARKADNAPVVGYEKWLEEIDAFFVEDVSDELWAEIEHGFFRRAPV